jgi:uncharacterized protein YlxW (UPF0749 family)
LREQYAQISEEKDRLYQEYRKLQQKVKQHENVRANLEQLIRPGKTEKQEEKENQIPLTSLVSCFIAEWTERSSFSVVG